MNGQLTPSEIARRGALMLQVAAGELRAADAAQELGVSRQLYHQWEKRAQSAVRALMEALQPKPLGRPKGTTGRPWQKGIGPSSLRP